MGSFLLGPKAPNHTLKRTNRSTVGPLTSSVRPLMNIPALVGGTTPIWWCEFAPKTVEAWGGTCTLSKAVIGMALDESGYYLFECTPDWHTVFDTWYESFDLALSAAVFEYPEAKSNGIYRSNR